MSTSTPITTKCLFCNRLIDGHFWNDNKTKIYDLRAAAKVIAVAAEYEKKRGFLHVACRNGLQAVKDLQNLQVKPESQ